MRFTNFSYSSKKFKSTHRKMYVIDLTFFKTLQLEEDEFLKHVERAMRTKKVEMENFIVFSSNFVHSHSLRKIYCCTQWKAEVKVGETKNSRKIHSPLFFISFSDCQRGGWVEKNSFSYRRATTFENNAEFSKSFWAPFWLLFMDFLFFFAFHFFRWKWEYLNIRTKPFNRMHVYTQSFEFNCFSHEIDNREEEKR